ncbi:TPA: FAD-dependent oxidoreductase [Streptococcus suis]
MEIIIIGASFAGLAAAVEARKTYPQANICLIDQEKEVGFFPNAFNWRMKNRISTWEEATCQLYEEVVASDIELLLETRFLSLSHEENVIQISQNGQVKSLSFDYLILAMGSCQVWEYQSQDSRERMLSCKSKREALSAFEKVATAKKISVIGAGQIGLETIDALSEYPIELQLIESQEWPLAKYFDQEMTEFILEELDRRNIKTYFGQTVNRLGIEDGSLVCETYEESIQADFGLLATNFRPNSQFLQGQLELDPDGCLVVDAFLETSRSGVFAVGDLIRLPFAFFGQAYLPMINHAILTGRLAVANLQEKKRPLKDVVRIVSSRIFGVNMTSVGLTEKEAQLWLDTDVVRIQQPYSQWDKEKLDFKLVLSQTDGRLLGGQLISKSDHLAQMNQLAFAIQQGLRIEDLLQQSWLCLPQQTALVPILIEAANYYYHDRRRREGDL